MSMASGAVSTMKTYHIVSLFFAFMFISTYGIELQENGTMSNIEAVSRATTCQTNADDVDGLVAIYNKLGYTSLLDWYTTGGDPCLPFPLTWIECNSDPNPRVISLNLHNKLLYDALADFSSMDALQTIDLSLNELMGVIPAFLGSFPNYDHYLHINSFFGQIPDSIACNKNLTYSVDGNAYVLTISRACSSSTSPNQASPSNSVFDTPTSTSTPSFTYTPSRTTYKWKSKLPSILGSTGSILLFLTSASVGIYVIFRRKAKTADAIPAASALPPGFGPDSTPINQKNMPTEENCSQLKNCNCSQLIIMEHYSQPETGGCSIM